MKKYSKLAAAVLIAGFALTGCSANATPEKATEITQQQYDEAQLKTEVKEDVVNFYTVSTDKSTTAVENLKTAPEKMTALISAEDIQKLGESEDPFKAIESLNPETQEKVAEFYKGLDPVADYYSYDELSASEKSIISLTSLVTTTFLATPEFAEAGKSITEDDVTVNDATHATVKFAEAASATAGARTEMFMVKVGEEWKIDGKKTIKQYKDAEAAANSTTTASPEAESTTTPETKSVDPTTPAK